MTSVGRVRDDGGFHDVARLQHAGRHRLEDPHSGRLGRSNRVFRRRAVNPRRPRVAMVDEHGTLEASALIQAMAAASFDVSVVTREQAEDGITAGTLKSALVIPEGFADSLSAGPTSLEVLHGEGLRPARPRRGRCSSGPGPGTRDTRRGTRRRPRTPEG